MSNLDKQETIIDIPIVSWVKRHKLSLMNIGFIRNFVYGIRNLWDFRKEVWNYRSWDGSYCRDIFARSIEIMADNIERNGYEIPETKDPKIKQMRRFVWLSRNLDNVIELAEEELGEIEHRSIDSFFGPPDENGNRQYIPDTNPHTHKVFDRSRELEMEIWDEMWEIIKGTDDGEYVETETHGKVWVSSGKDMRGWWD